MLWFVHTNFLLCWVLNGPGGMPDELSEVPNPVFLLNFSEIENSVQHLNGKTLYL